MRSAVADGSRSAVHAREPGGMFVNPDVAALLAVQADDLRAYGLEDRLNALIPRLTALEQERKRAEEAIARARQDVEAEEQRQRELQDRLRQHRELREKSENLLG